MFRILWKLCNEKRRSRGVEAGLCFRVYRPEYDLTDPLGMDCFCRVTLGKLDGVYMGALVTGAVVLGM